MSGNHFDPVDRPEHYVHNGIETIDVIEAWTGDYHIGNVIKYLSRWESKGGVEDLKKARWYLDRKIRNLDSTP